VAAPPFYSAPIKPCCARLYGLLGRIVYVPVDEGRKHLPILQVQNIHAGFTKIKKF